MIRYIQTANPRAFQGTALLRLDFNTEDAWRMEAALPTARFLLKRADKIVIISHRGRPAPAKIVAGAPAGFDKRLSLRRDARWLERFLKRRVRFIPHFRFGEIRETIAHSPRGALFLLENIRFLKGEKTLRPELAQKLASLADYYVFEAFAVAHHPADSVTGLERFLPSYGGLELEKEIHFLSRVMQKPARPLVLVIGGGKASDKLGVLASFKKKADAILLGGAPANTFLHLRGVDVKQSSRDTDPNDLKRLRPFLRSKNIHAPVDWSIRDGKILDIGSKTAKLYARKIREARTVFWSGPMGLIEQKPFDAGNFAVAQAIVSNRGAMKVTGGGETVMFLRKHRLGHAFDFISTGGGAMLEFLAGKKLPGIEALRKSKIA